MAWTPKDSAWTVTPEVEKEIENLDTEGLKEYFRTLSVRQGLTERQDWAHPEILTPTALAENARTRVKEITVNGTTYELTASTDEELLELELDLHRRLQTETEEPAAQPRTKTGQFAAPEQQATDDAVEAYLKNRGIEPEDLVSASARGFTQRWNAATQEFVAANPSWGRYASPEATRKVGEKLIELGLSEDPSAANLEIAVNTLIREGSLTESPNAALESRIGRMDSIEDIRTASKAAIGQPNSSWFYRQ